MNNAIHDAFINAVLAEASYVEGLSEGDQGTVLRDRLTNELSRSLADYVGQHFKVVKQTPEAASGFSVTVFQDRSTEQKYVSFRGTQDLSDWAADADIFIGSGTAYRQVKAMVNWYMRASTPQGAQAIQIADTSHIEGGQFVFDTYLALGTGEIAGSPDYIVDGHSLGGHLATAFARLFGNSSTKSFTYNGCGFTSGAESVFSMIERSLGVAPTNYPGETRQTNIFAEHGVNIATTNSGWISQFGNRVPVFNEESTTNHSMYKLTDALALFDAMGTIDSELKLEDVTPILDAASASPQASLETVLDALRRLCRTTDTTPTQIGDAADNAASRNDYHAKVNALRGLVEGDPTLRGRIVSLADKTSADLASLASSDVGYRYALKALNPFAVTGAAALYDSFNANGALDRLNPATGKGLSDGWITARAKFVSELAAYNRTDGSGGAQSVKGYYQDQQMGITLGLNSGGRSRYIFASDANTQAVIGYEKNDFLFGGAGDDIVVGNTGNDYLEGGAGNDTYIYSLGDGLDTIFDSDGVGSIQMDLVTLVGGTSSGDGRSFKWTDNNSKEHSYVLLSGDLTSGGDLLVDEKITIKNFKNGNLGLTLNTTQQTPQTGLTIVGDLEPINFALPTDPPGTVSWHYDALGNVIVSGNPEPNRNDYITGSSGNDRIEGGGGSDYLWGWGGDDIVIGYGTLSGGVGNDYISVGQEVSIADAINNGNAQQGISSSGSLLTGDSNFRAEQGGRDILLGGAGDDEMQGDGGQDVLVGGAGDDDISGDNWFQSWVYNPTGGGITESGVRK